MLLINVTSNVRELLPALTLKHFLCFYAFSSLQRKCKFNKCRQSNIVMHCRWKILVMYIEEFERKSFAEKTETWCSYTFFQNLNHEIFTELSWFSFPSKIKITSPYTQKIFCTRFIAEPVGSKRNNYRRLLGISVVIEI